MSSSSEGFFEPGPEFFNRIQLRRIGGQENQGKTRTVYNLKQLLLSVKGSIIHNNNGTLRKTWQKNLLKPGFEQLRIGRTGILHRRKNFPAHFCGNKIGTLEFSPRNGAGNSLPAGGIGIFPIKIRIQSGFIDIGNLFFWNILYLILIGYDLFLVLLPITRRFFLRVIPSRLKAFETATSLHPNTFPISP